MRKRKWKLPNWLDLTLSFQVQFFQSYLQHSTFHLLLSQSADCQNPWENCEILSLFSKIWLFHSTMCWIHFWSSILFSNLLFLIFIVLLWVLRHRCSTSPLVLDCCELSHVIFLKQKKKELLARLSKFTKWQPFSIKNTT